MPEMAEMFPPNARGTRQAKAIVLHAEKLSGFVTGHGDIWMTAPQQDPPSVYICVPAVRTD